MSFEYRSCRSEAVIVAAVMFAAMAILAFGAIETEAADGETIEYVEGGGDYAIVYDSPSLDGAQGSMFHATVTDSTGNSFLDDGTGGTYFAEIKGSCVLTLTKGLEDGLYQVKIWTDQATLYEGPIIVGEASLTIDLDPMTVGDTATFADILAAAPVGLSDHVVWGSSDESVLRITETGVEAVKVGKATLTATYEYIAGDIVDTVDVDVTPIKVTENGASISGAQSVQVGSSFVLSLTVDEGASGYSVEWTADPAAAVTIVSNGDGSVTVTGMQVTESVTIAATINNFDGSTVTKTHTITVEKVPVTSVEITTVEGMALGVNGTTSLEYKISPENATNKEVTWSSSDTSVATVSADGTITGLKEGTTTITVTSKDNTGATDTYSLTVEVVHVDRVSLDKTTLKMEVGDTETLVATVLPGTAGNKAVIWSSSDSDVVSVSNGVVTAKGLGSSTVTVTTVDGSKTATCTVVVQKTQLNVTFYDGNGDFLKTIAVAENEAIDTSDLPDLSKISGTDFKTWFSDEDLKSVFDFSTPITSSIPVYGGVYSDTNIKINKNGVLSTTADGRENISGDLVIPYGVTEIKNEAFKGSGITSVSLPNGLKRIGESSFEGCKNLTGSLVIPESVNKIDYCAFKNTSITSAVLKTTNLMYELNGDGDYRDLFKSCTELETVTLSSGVDTIAMGMFYGCTKLSKIDISEGCKYIMGNSFNGCTSLERIEIPSSVISISDANGNPDSYAFSGCINLKSIEINKPKDSIEFAPWDCPNEDAVKWLG